MHRRRVRRIARPVSTDLPPSADKYTPAPTPSVTINHAVGSTIHVKTFSGVEISCTVVGTRDMSGDTLYEVKPRGDLKVKELQKAGVPITPENVGGHFMAFEWQISKKGHT